MWLICNPITDRRSSWINQDVLWSPKLLPLLPRKKYQLWHQWLRCIQNRHVVKTCSPQECNGPFLCRDAEFIIVGPISKQMVGLKVPTEELEASLLPLKDEPVVCVLYRTIKAISDHVTLVHVVVGWYYNKFNPVRTIVVLGQNLSNLRKSVCVMLKWEEQ